MRERLRDRHRHRQRDKDRLRQTYKQTVRDGREAVTDRQRQTDRQI